MAASAFFDRVLETTTTTGTGTLTLAGAVTGYQTFASVGNGNTTPMAVWEVDANGNPSGAWEVANTCTYTAAGTTLTRGTFLASSTGSAINFGAGTKRVAQSLPAAILQGLVYGSQTAISGLELQWVSTTAVDITTGSAYVQSVEKIVQVPATISLTGLSLGNSAWGYVYLIDATTAECNTTAPAAPYAGNARSKTGDTSRRFLGTVRTDSSGNIYQFRHVTTTGLIRYLAQALDAAPFRILSNGSATTATAVSAAAVIPPQSRTGLFWLQRVTTVASAAVFASNEYTVSSTAFELQAPTSLSASLVMAITGFCGVDTSQQINYLNISASSGTYAGVLGYILER